MCSVLAGRDDIEPTAAMNIRPMLHATLFQKLLTSSALALAATCVIATSASAQSLKVEWANERLTIVAADAPFADVVREIERLTAATFNGAEHLSGTITLEIRDARLVDAVRALLADRPYLMIEPSSDGKSRVAVWLQARDVSSKAQACPDGTSPNSPRQVSCGPAANDAVPPGASPNDPSGPRTDTEVARLEAAGFFRVDATESTLMSVAKSPDPAVRARALQTLGIQSTKIGLRALTEALDDPDPFVRAEALDMLVSQSPGADSVRRLGDLLEHKDASVRFPAVMALGEQSGEEAEFLLKRALNDDEGAIKEAAAQLLKDKEKKGTKKNP
jgi:hypothetical protein